MYKNINELVLKSIKIPFVTFNQINKFATVYQTTSTAQATETTKAASAHSSLNKINKQVTAKNQQQTDLVSFIRNNKLAVLFWIFATSNVVYFLKPLHIRRPEILARNRTERPSEQTK